jgi:hypothetical protein
MALASQTIVSRWALLSAAVIVLRRDDDPPGDLIIASHECLAGIGRDRVATSMIGNYSAPRSHGPVMATVPPLPATSSP